MSTQNNVFLSGCQIEPSPVVASALKARFEFNSFGVKLHDEPVIKGTVNIIILIKFFMVNNLFRRLLYMQI